MRYCLPPIFVSVVVLLALSRSTLTQGYSLPRLCDEQSTACLANGFSTDECAAQYEDCLGGVEISKRITEHTSLATRSPDNLLNAPVEQVLQQQEKRMIKKRNDPFRGQEMRDRMNGRRCCTPALNT
ncbi:hypothetical protein SISSUDRAFT_1050886 [Sistotremastrum suecicum HHB10207 ss-3]|uniref:Uncharacterized protein n=1 Tax=Sistotremastrum suecicum HHB10207 ss-3 TaxID=1314776 RepID=A0A166AXA4_9AGAM|nr:hypothetical protein SISSUDRAFT_1050886 [Sistotremastrum suecicum HHB10207 ss-3]